MNLKRYINTTRDKTGLGHSWGKGWPPGPWSEVLGHCHPGGSLEDNQGGRPDHNWWVESSSWCWGNYFHPSLSPGVLLKTVSASVPQTEPLWAGEAHNFCSQSRAHLMIYSKQNLVQVLWEYFAIQAKNIRKFLSDADSNTNEGASSTLSSTCFLVQFSLDYFYLCTWDAKWTTPDFPTANKGGSLWFSNF